MAIKSQGFELGMWEIAVLSLLRDRPVHPYQIQRLLRLRHKDEILARKRGSLYHATRRLVDPALIAVEAMRREGKRPERAIYRIRPEGLEASVNTLRRIVSTPWREASEFMAAMRFLVHFEPKEAMKLLDKCAQRLVDQMAERATALASAATHVESGFTSKKSHSRNVEVPQASIPTHQVLAKRFIRRAGNQDAAIRECVKRKLFGIVDYPSLSVVALDDGP